MARLELKVPPVAVFLVCAGAIWLAHAVCPGADVTLPDRRLIVLLLGVAGGGLGAGAVAMFLCARTTVHPECPERAARLVTTGVYRLSRNPMYTGLLFALAAEAVHFGNAAGFLMLPVFVAYLNRFQIAPEERALREKFGPRYEAFCRTTRRWL